MSSYDRLIDCSFLSIFAVVNGIFYNALPPKYLKSTHRILLTIGGDILIMYVGGVVVGASGAVSFICVQNITEGILAVFQFDVLGLCPICV